MAALFAWLIHHGLFCTKSRRDLSLRPQDRPTETRVAEHCTFCQAYSNSRHAFDIVWEDDDFLAFRDRWPASLHHIQLIPKSHISSVKQLTRQDVDMVKRMEQIGSGILDELQVPQAHRKMGFHIPPFNSVQHLHLHVQALPYTSFLRMLKYPISGGFGTFDKGFSWFSEVGQTIRILERGSTVRVYPC